MNYCKGKPLRKVYSKYLFKKNEVLLCALRYSNNTFYREYLRVIYNTEECKVYIESPINANVFFPIENRNIFSSIKKNEDIIYKDILSLYEKDGVEFLYPRINPYGKVEFVGLEEYENEKS